MEREVVEKEIEICVRNIVVLWGESMNGDEVEETTRIFKERLAQMMGEED